MDCTCGFSPDITPGLDDESKRTLFSELRLYQLALLKQTGAL